MLDLSSKWAFGPDNEVFTRRIALSEPVRLPVSLLSFHRPLIYVQVLMLSSHRTLPRFAWN
jgi:hypothetical protein